MYQRLIKTEQQRSAARKIKWALGKMSTGPTSSVDIINNGERTTVTQKEQLEKVCMHSIKEKYIQTSNTPCMIEPLKRMLGLGDTETSKMILEGTFNPPHFIPQYTTELLRELRRTVPDNYNAPSMNISSQRFSKGWKKMKEFTSGGPSGLHFGHMKACATDPFLAQVESCVCSIPPSIGFSPTQWQQGVTSMILKRSGSNLVDDLRSICVCEADFNFFTKTLGYKTMQHAEKLNLIAPEQYGSRSGKSSIDHAVHKKLWYDILRQKRQPGAMCSNDAKSCYDRVVHSIASLAYQRLGIPLPPITTLLKTIQKMKHHIRTSYGDSTFYLSADKSLTPFQGILQGCGSSPATWVIISSPLINMLRTAQNGSFTTSAISKKTTHLVAFPFVDDTDLPCTDFRTENISNESVMNAM